MKKPKQLTVVVSPVDEGVECLIDMSRVEAAWPYDDYITVKMRNGTNISVTPDSWDKAVEASDD